MPYSFFSIFSNDNTTPLKEYLKAKHALLPEKLNTLIEQAKTNLEIDENRPDFTREMKAEFDRMIQFVGDCPNLFPEVQSNDINSPDPEKYIPAGLKFLLNKRNYESFSKKAFNAAFYHDTDTKFKIANNAIKQALAYLCIELNKAHQNSNEKLVWILTINISQLLSFYVFMKPSSGETISIPQKVGERWQLVAYTVELLPLFVRQEHENLYAYACTPLSDNMFNYSIHPFLIFRGTPPFDFYQGCITARAADTRPDETIGEFLIEGGYNELKQWFEKNEDKFAKVIITGHSLGGASAVLAGSFFPQHTHTVNAFNPSGIENATRARTHYQEGLQFTPKPSFNVFSNQMDTVSNFGYWDNFWNVYTILPKEELSSLLPFNHKCAHVLNYLGQEQFIICKVNPEAENKKLMRALSNSGKSNFSGIAFSLVSWSAQKNTPPAPLPTNTQAVSLSLTYDFSSEHSDNTIIEQLKFNIQKNNFSFSAQEIKKLKEFFEDFIKSSVQNTQHIIQLIEAIGIGNGNEMGKDPFLSNARLDSLHDRYDFFSSASYNETVLSRHIANQLGWIGLKMIQTKECSITRKFLISNEEHLAFTTIFSKLQTTAFVGDKNILQHYQSNIDNKIIIIQKDIKADRTSSLAVSYSKTGT